MEEKTLVCATPFSIEDIPVITNLTNFLPSYVMDSVVSPVGLGLDNKDIGVIENRSNLGYIVTSNLKDSIKSCNVVLILSKNMYSPLYDYAIKAIEEAINQRKDIICLLRLNRDTIDHYNVICQNKNINFRYISQEHLPHILYKDTLKPLYNTYAPVIFVGELTEGIQGYEVFCNLIRMFRSKGIKVSAVGPDTANTLFGLHTIDFSNIKGELSDHIYRINKYIRKIEQKENPGIIIIKLPKPMIKFNEDVRYDFGASAYLISQAISTSYFIVCSPYGFFSNEFWSSMSENFQAKFGYRIDAIHISNKVIDNSNEMDKDKLDFIHIHDFKAKVNIEKVSNKTTNFLLGNLNDSYYIEKIFSDINCSLLNAPYELIT